MDPAQCIKDTFKFFKSKEYIKTLQELTKCLVYINRDVRGPTGALTLTLEVRCNMMFVAFKLGWLEAFNHFKKQFLAYLVYLNEKKFFGKKDVEHLLVIPALKAVFFIQTQKEMSSMISLSEILKDESEFTAENIRSVLHVEEKITPIKKVTPFELLESVTPFFDDIGDVCSVCKTLTRKQCKGCHKVMFCGEDCLKVGWKKFHKKQCKLFQTLNKGIDLTTINDESKTTERKFLLYSRVLNKNQTVFDFDRLIAYLNMQKQIKGST